MSGNTQTKRARPQAKAEPDRRVSAIPPDSPFFWNTGEPSVMRPVEDRFAAARKNLEISQARRLRADPSAKRPLNTAITLPGSLDGGTRPAKLKKPAVDWYDYPRDARGRFLPMKPGQVWRPVVGAKQGAKYV